MRDADSQSPTLIASRLPLLALLRPQQWVKNVFVAAPLFFTPSAMSAANAVAVAAGFACFCVLASGVYVANDYLDREADRNHPTKRLRPLASGAVAPGRALALAAALVLAGLGFGYLLSPSFALIAAAYVAVNLMYSLGLKSVSIIDVMLVATGFVLRIMAGSALIAVVPTSWIILIAGLLALFLALAKRRDDLSVNAGSDHRRSLSGYNKAFLDSALTMTLGALLVSYLVYTTDASVQARLGSENLYVTAPFVVAGILRYLQLIFIDERSGAPAEILLSDTFLQLAVLGWIACFAVLVYL